MRELIFEEISAVSGGGGTSTYEPAIIGGRHGTRTTYTPDHAMGNVLAANTSTYGGGPAGQRFWEPSWDFHQGPYGTGESDDSDSSDGGCQTFTVNGIEYHLPEDYSLVDLNGDGQYDYDWVTNPDGGLEVSPWRSADAADDHAALDQSAFEVGAGVGTVGFAGFWSNPVAVLAYGIDASLAAIHNPFAGNPPEPAPECDNDE